MCRIFLLSILAACLAAGWAIECTEGICDNVDCATSVEDGHQPPCNDDQILTNRTFCGCCEICVTLVGEGEACGVHIDLTTPPIPYDCEEGLTCVNDSLLTGECVKQE